MDIEKGDVEASGNVSSEENPQSKGDAAASATEQGMNVEDFLLPRSITQRLAKGVLPPNTAIHRDAMLAMTKAATVFVSYLSSHANEETNKKTITPQDVLAALSGIEFEGFRPRLERELALYTEAAAQKRRGKKGEKGPSNTGGNIEEANGEPENKRLKRDTGDQEEKDQEQKAGNGGSVANGDSKMSGHHDAQWSKDRGQDGDDKSDDSTDTMEDTNNIDDEEESNDDGDKRGEEDEEDEDEEEEEEEGKGSSQEIDIESDASRKRNRRDARSELDSNSGSDSDGF